MPYSAWCGRQTAGRWHEAPRIPEDDKPGGLMPRAAKDPGTGVTPQQERFAFEYIKSGRPGIAYQAAYNTKAGYEMARVEGRRLLDNPSIAIRVEHYRKIAESKLEVTVQRIVQETARIAFFDMRNLVDDDGNAIPLQELDEDTARALNGMDIEELYADKGKDREAVVRVKKYKHVQKMEALRLLAQWKKMLVEQREVGKPGEFANLSDAEVEQQAHEAVALAVKMGKLKLVKSGPKQTTAA